MPHDDGLNDATWIKEQLLDQSGKMYSSSSNNGVVCRWRRLENIASYPVLCQIEEAKPLVVLDGSNGWR